MTHRWRSLASRHLLIITLLGAPLAAAPAIAQETTGRARQEDPAQLLDNFVHYALIAHPQMAAAYAQSLLDGSLTDAELAELLDETGGTTVERFDDAVRRALSTKEHPELEAVAAELARRIEQGRLDLARDPERIDEAIGMLTDHQRARLLAERRLEVAGEYAVPALLRTLTESEDERLKTRAIDVLHVIGRQAVRPLTAALLALGDDRVQIVVADVLGDIGHPQAVPALKELSQRTQAGPDVRQAAERALARIGGGEKDLATLYTTLGRQYFAEAESLISFPNEPTNNVWSYNPFVGLEIHPVPTPIFDEVMAMRMAERALRAAPGNPDARSLFVAANLKRKNELPEGLGDPVYGQDPYTPAFYATVFGARTSLDVLAMGVDSLNTPLVRDAIQALRKTTGGSNLFAAGGDRQPLLEALQYPDRRAQYEAALTLAEAAPSEPFSGDFAVVPLLASAVRTGNRSFAIVIADDPEDRRVLSNMLEQQQFEIAGAEGDVANLQIPIADAPGVDLVIIKQSDPNRTVQTVRDLRLIPKTSAAPVLIQAGAIDMIPLRRELDADRAVRVERAGLDEQELAQQVTDALAATAGGRITEAEAEEYALQALQALRDIAVSRSPAYSIADAESALLDALAERTGGVRTLVAAILAMIDSERAQRALWEAAFAAPQGEQIPLLEQLAESVKRHGSHAQPHHITSLIDLIENSRGDLAEGAARVHGALNLPVTDAVSRLILR